MTIGDDDFAIPLDIQIMVVNRLQVAASQDQPPFAPRKRTRPAIHVEGLFAPLGIPHAVGRHKRRPAGQNQISGDIEFAQRIRLPLARIQFYRSRPVGRAHEDRVRLAEDRALDASRLSGRRTNMKVDIGRNVKLARRRRGERVAEMQRIEA